MSFIEQYESVAEKLSKKTLEHSNVSSGSLKPLQKEVIGGQIVTGRMNDSGTMVMYRSDLVAHAEDFYRIINDSDLSTELDSIIDHNSYVTWLEGSALVSTVAGAGDEFQPPDNVSQFVEFHTNSVQIDPSKAREVLDTSISELMPTVLTRQQRINNFFQEFNLLIGEPPTFIENPEGSGNFVVDTLNTNDISNFPNDENAYITRIDLEATVTNTNQTLEWMRDTLNEYLADTDSQPQVQEEDTRPIYAERSNGHLEIRNLNHAIIIKQEEGRELEFSKEEEIDVGIWNDLYGE